MNHQFRKATISEIPKIWDILQKAISRRKKDGSNQWQDGYPNPEVIKNDIDKNAGFVLTEGETIIGYTALLISDEPEYEKIVGKWLTNNDFVVFHRVAISENHLGKGLATKLVGFIEDFAISNNIYSIKADTNFDNFAMIKVFDKLGYVYCGEVYFRGSARKAYEKIITKK
ncbi:GNAT family N-acetyltransferase [Flavobacterium sp. XN-5]|uniref:GNAT family N-acetyltransferase n=1 Tax=Flavobacterium sp. XN-5 TaxID=2599390 RepID=UPI0011C87CFB|nr:GNAT family N-acetyltransferase [Flavobacterium sp. XN-5]NGY37950.1 GNAT family N-acetyltransferase [Flavobacterium sp. XN-5]